MKPLGRIPVEAYYWRQKETMNPDDAIPTPPPETDVEALVETVRGGMTLTYIQPPDPRTQKALAALTTLAQRIEALEQKVLWYEDGLKQAEADFTRQGLRGLAEHVRLRYEPNPATKSWANIPNHIRYRTCAIFWTRSCVALSRSASLSVSRAASVLRVSLVLPCETSKSSSRLCTVPRSRLPGNQTMASVGATSGSTDKNRTRVTSARTPITRKRASGCGAWCRIQPQLRGRLRQNRPGGGGETWVLF